MQSSLVNRQASKPAVKTVAQLRGSLWRLCWKTLRKPEARASNTLSKQGQVLGLLLLNLTVKRYAFTGQTSGLPVFALLPQAFTSEKL